MAKALYRKYRSKSLSEIVGQEHITTTLQNALKKGHISHAYLFTGPRGVGKTSVARILAHEINGLPYTDDATHMDIIEIDAASNRRIDEIRDLRDKVHITPAAAKYKVYIIDEVHMLTKEAFNALLKTLEEPPAHAVFILATTEAHKLPETIVSRTQRFTFKPIGTDQAVAHLRHIAETENIKIDDEALRLLAAHGGGSFRDSISLLDQISSHSSQTIGKGDVERLLGIASNELIEHVAAAVVADNTAELLAALQMLRDQGVSPAQIAKQLAGTWRAQLINGTAALPPEQLVPLLTRLLEVPAAQEPFNLLELLLLGAHFTHTPPQPIPVSEAAPAPAAPKSKASPAGSKPAKSADGPAPEEPARRPKTETASPSTDEPPADGPALKKTEDTAYATVELEDIGAIQTWWPAVLNLLKAKYNTLYGVMRLAETELDGTTLTLRFAFPFHQKRIKDAANQQKVHEIIQQVIGRPLAIRCEVDASLKDRAAGMDTAPQTAEVTATIELSNAEPDTATITNSNNEMLQNVAQVFGGGEIL